MKIYQWFCPVVKWRNMNLYILQGLINHPNTIILACSQVTKHEPVHFKGAC
jgi:hypothetical protein